MKKIYGFFAVAAMLSASVSAQAETSVWDGSIDTEWSTDADGAYLITSASELAGLSKKVDDGDSYLGAIFKLTTDINLNNIEYWTPIGSISKQHSSNTTKDEKYFKGTFDGQGHFVEGCNVYLTGPTSVWAGTDGNIKPVTAGLFGAINSKTIIKNLAVKNSSFVADCAKCYDAMSAAICAYNDGGTIINCSAYDNVISCTSTFGSTGAPHAGGISGYTEGDATIEGNYVSNNTISVNGDKEYSNEVAVVRGGNTDLSSNCSSADDYEAWRAAKNEEAFLYCNLGVQLGSEVPSPYYWDENGITNDIYYVLMIDEARSEHPERKRGNAEFSEANEKMTAYVWRTEVGGDGNTYTLFAAGSTATIVTHLEGATANGTDSGFFVKHIGDMPATIGDVISDDRNFSAETGRYERVQEFSIVMPAEMTTIWYEANTEATTGIEDVEVSALQVIVEKGKVVVETAIGNPIIAVDMTGRVLYSDVAHESKTEIALNGGFYIVNGVKVVVK